MKLIELTKNKYAIVDDEDYDYLSSFGSWYMGNEYPQRIQKTKHNKNGKTLLMHCIIWNRHFGEKPTDKLIDHIDNNGLNNQKNNLRLATFSQNAINSKTRKICLSRYKGVHLDKRRGNYQAMIRVNNKLMHIGMFAIAEDAAFAFDLCASAIHGEYAYINNVPFSQEGLDVVRGNKKIQEFFRFNL